MQEMNRETNTIGSKANNAKIARIVVDMKGELEKMREQIQNMSASRIVAIASPDSAPVKRLVQDAKEDGRIIDVSCGRRTRAVIITDSDHVILSAIQTETISNRLSLDLEEEEEE